MNPARGAALIGDPVPVAEVVAVAEAEEAACDGRHGDPAQVLPGSQPWSYIRLSPSRRQLLPGAQPSIAFFSSFTP